MTRISKGIGLKDAAHVTLRFIIVAGAAVLLALNYQLFIIVNDFAPAGLNGIATMVQYKTGFSIGYMSLLINVPLCVAAFFLIERRFAVNSLCFCLVYSAAYLLLDRVELQQFRYDANGHDTIFPVILSGVISGFVYAVCVRNLASTGGTDIISKFISVHKPEWSFFYVSFALNAAVAVVSFFVYAKPDAAQGMIYDYRPVCLCILYCFISSFTGSSIIVGSRRACEFTVITSHAEEIARDVSENLRHGATQVTAKGTHDKQEKGLLICVVNRNQIADFQKILQKYDDTFAFCETVDETYGNFRRER